MHDECHVNRFAIVTDPLSVYLRSVHRNRSLWARLERDFFPAVFIETFATRAEARSMISVMMKRDDAMMPCQIVEIRTDSGYTTLATFVASGLPAAAETVAG